jgi:hypothetical protein
VNPNTPTIAFDNGDLREVSRADAAAILYKEPLLRVSRHEFFIQTYDETGFGFWNVYELYDGVTLYVPCRVANFRALRGVE